MVNHTLKALQHLLHKKWNFPLRISPVNVTKTWETADLVAFAGEILNGKLHFLCRGSMCCNLCLTILWILIAIKLYLICKFIVIVISRFSDNLFTLLGDDWNIDFLFYQGFFFTDTDNSQDSRGKEGTIFYSTLPLPPVHEHSDIYLQPWTWDDYHIFLIATLCIYQAATRWDLPPCRIAIWLIDDVMLTFVCLLVDLIRFCYGYFPWENGGLELASTIILVLQANRLTMCASHPNRNIDSWKKKHVWLRLQGFLRFV